MTGSRASNQLSLWQRCRAQFNPRPPDDDDPQDWWFASMAIPLIAATTSPFANVMSIIALAMPWTGELQPAEDNTPPVQVPVKDPGW